MNNQLPNYECRCTRSHGETTYICERCGGLVKDVAQFVSEVNKALAIAEGK